MSLIGKTLLSIAALLLFVATALGAYASHGLENVLEPRALQSFQVAVDYQFYHGLGMMTVTALGERYEPALPLRLAGCLFGAGIVLFCGAIYATTLGAPAWLGSATPLGGLCFMAGWLICAYAAWRIAPTMLR